MINENWNKETKMETNQTEIALIKQRLDQHELILKDVQQIKTDVATLVQRFSNFNPNCSLHAMRVDTLEKELNSVRDDVKGITKKIIFWSGIFSVIIFLITYLIIPVVVDKIKSETQTVTMSQNQR